MNQTYKNLVLIIVDDGSTDPDVQKMLAEAAKNTTRLKVYSLETNKGVANALNEGVRYALDIEGVEFIARMDSDDISLPKRIQIQVDFMVSNP
jgi:glycosyltransferase involved in cell wall biosynthesis